MAEEWKEVTADQVKAGDRIRIRGQEITVNRVDDTFMGRDNFLAFIEDNDERWFKAPSASDAVVEVAAVG